MKKQQLLKSKITYYLSLLLLILVFSCRSTNEENIKGGIGILKVNMQGAQFSGNEKGMFDSNASISPMMRGVLYNPSSEIEIAKIPLKEDYFLIATLSSESSSSPYNLQASANNVMATTSVINKLPDGIKYRMVVYDTNNTIVDQKVYTTGSSTPDDGQDLELIGGNTYKFVIYSYNSDEVPSPVTPSNTTSYDVSGNKDFMYYTAEKVISGETTNYLDVVMMHKYTKLNISIDTSEIGTVSEVSGVSITPHYVSNKVDLTNGNLTYDSNAVIAPVTLSGVNSTTLTGTSIVCAPSTNATLSIGSITIDGAKQSNKEVSFNLNPGVSTNLTLKVQRLVTINVMQIASSWYHTIALTESGDVYGTGHITYGELGPEKTLQQKPIQRALFSEWYVTRFNKLNIDNVKKIAVSDGATYMLKKTGELYVGGVNDHGQLGIGSKSNTGHNGDFVKVDFFGGAIKDIIGGMQSVFILTEDGQVFAAGRNGNGQLGVGDLSDKTNFVSVKGLEGYQVEQITAGEYHVVVKTTSGKLFATGRNSSGELGIGTTKGQKGFVEVTSVSNVKEVRGHAKHTIVVTNTGDLYATGNNKYGQLGLGDTRSQNSFVRVLTMSSPIVSTLEGPTSEHTIVVSTTGQVYGAGTNDYAVLGLGNINVSYSSFKELPLQNK
ncbi:TPA: chromosome condensation regulator RCC1 [Elizabethkingia anophelis]|nr:chromosome condensation regulator RCC1 [Elizabethkingia anophelis]HAT3997861.1 chromosome condensation regulator RCC1 [Elizabethkingia anophelis]HAT4005462.1 chromosome condensation regulator RCC1 [Elizabethkingia anophelis]